MTKTTCAPLDAAVLRGRSVDHNRTLAKVIRERDAEIARPTLGETEPD